MKTFTLPLLTLAILALAACNQATTPNTSGSPTAQGSSAVSSASARATSSVAASASASAATKYVDLKVVVPEDNAKAGVNGVGWTVDVIAKGNGPAMDKIKPAFTQGGSTGKNAAFPGLVVMLKSTSQGGQAGNPNTNLAKLFQIVGLPNTLGSTSISSVTTASSTPAASASGGATGASGASASPAGSAATRTTTTSSDNDTAEATWFVQQTLWGSDVDVELTVFVVDGDAPDTVTDKSSLKIVSNEVTVKFHINGGASAPSGSSAPSATPAGSPAASPSGSPRPSGSPSSTP